MKILLAYSGGLDTSVLLSWIKEKYNAEMVAYCANVGQEEELSGLEEKSKKTGASKIYIEDLQEEFARDFIFPMMQAGAIYEGQYFLGTSIARPLIAKRMVEIAKAEGCGRLEWSCLDWNQPSIDFYKSLNACSMDEWTVYRLTGKTLQDMAQTLGE